MFDVFYYGTKPNLFAHERPAADLDEAADLCRTKFFWYITGDNDYTDFDWHWQPAPWEQTYTHIFGTQWQRDGGAVFRVKHVDQNIDHYQTEFKARHLACAPVLDVNTSDYFNNVVAAVKQTTAQHVWITNRMVDYGDFDFSWHPESYQNDLMHIFSSDPEMPGSTLYLPVSDFLAYAEQCLSHATELEPQLVDFARIQRHYVQNLREKPLDIIYISNGEPDAEHWYKHTAQVAHGPVHRVMNVPGRAHAYRAAALTSSTDWFFAVFAKLSVSADFDWRWQPDRVGLPEQHYIFHAHNPVNGLEYGHMAMIAYNKRLVLDTHEPGLDFTLSKPHSVVPILSGTAHFNASEFMTWRTAFREVLKLVHTDRTNPSIPNLFRLQAWLTQAQGDFAEYSLRGARDAVEYYDSVDGNMEQLKLSFDWPWLWDYFKKKL